MKLLLLSAMLGGSVFANCAVHLTFLFIILQTLIFFHPVFTNPMAKHFIFFLIPLSRCYGICSISFGLAFFHFIFSLWGSLLPLEFCITLKQKRLIFEIQYGTFSYHVWFFRDYCTQASSDSSSSIWGEMRWSLQTFVCLSLNANWLLAHFISYIWLTPLKRKIGFPS